MADDSPDDVEAKKSKMKKLMVVGVIFVVIGYGLILGALYLEVTGFHPAIDAFFSEHTGHSLAGGGSDRAGMTTLNDDLSEIHQFPSTLLWMKLGGIGHVLVGIFISLFVIVQALMMMPDRLAQQMGQSS